MPENNMKHVERADQVDRCMHLNYIEKTKSSMPLNIDFKSIVLIMIDSH